MSRSHEAKEERRSPATRSSSPPSTATSSLWRSRCLPYEGRPQFRRDFQALTPEAQRLFREAVTKFIADLRAGRFRAGLRVKRVQGREGVWEMTWAPDGRATFHYGEEVRSGEPHIVWRRIGTHDIFRQP